MPGPSPSTPVPPRPTPSPLSQPASIRRPPPANRPPGQRPINALATRWLIALIVALLLGASAVSPDADPEGLQATADARDDIANALEAHQARQAQAR